jgi:hypothetical protein
MRHKNIRGFIAHDQGVFSLQALARRWAMPAINIFVQRGATPMALKPAIP